MPNRILRDWTDSYTINDLSVEAERLFIRLIMKVDDWGRFHGDSRLILAACFPLLPSICLADVEQWLSECESHDCLVVYEDERGRKFIQINNFKQQTRAKSSKFPEPAVHTRSTRIANEHLDVVGDVVEDGYGDGADSGTGVSVSKLSSTPSKISKAKGSLEELRAYAVELGLPASDGEYMFNSWSSSGWMRGAKPLKDWRAGMRTWKSGGFLPSQKKSQSGSNGNVASEDDVAAQYGS